MTFLNTLAAKANNVCGEKNKKTVCPDHVIDAMVVSIQELNENPQLSCNIYSPFLLSGHALERVFRQDDKPRHEWKAPDEVPAPAAEEIEV